MNEKSILIVEDESVLLDLYFSILSKQNKYKVKKAVSAEEALALFHNNLFDLVLTDYHLPGKDGITLIKEIREKTDHTTFILISGYLSSQIVRKAIASGVWACLKKPSSIHTILSTVKQTLKFPDRHKSQLNQIFSFMDISPQKTIFFDSEKNILHASSDFKEIYGDVHGKKCYEVICPTGEECLNCPISGMNNENLDKAVYKAVKLPEGRLSVVEEHVEYWNDHNGKLIGYLLSIFFQEKPQENKLFLPEIITEDKTQSRHAVFMIDKKDNIIFVDKLFSKICEIDNNDLKKIKIFDLLHSYFVEYLKKQGKSFYEFSQENLNELLRLDFIRQNSVRRCTLLCEFRKMLFKDNPDETIVVICQNEEENKELAKLIEFERESSKQLLFGQFDMVISLDRELRIKTINNIAEKKLKLKKTGLIGKPISTLVKKDQDKIVLDKAIKQVGTLKDVFNLRLDIQAKNKIIPTLINISGVRDGFNNEIGFVMVLRDIEKELKMEDTLSSIERMQALGQLAAGLSHQINNYIAAISGSTDLMSLDIQNPVISKEKILSSLRNYLKTIRISLTKLTGLTKHLTQFAKAQQRPVFSKGSINMVIRDVQSFAELRIKKKGIKLIFSLDEKLPEIFFSPLHLEQAVLNILMNAIDAVEQTKGYIIISTIKQGDWVYIIIEDNGPGIPSFIRDRIFDAFVTSKPSGVGTGLGLNVAKDMIASMRGEIECKTEEGVGTKMIIKLPIIKQDEII